MNIETRTGEIRGLLLWLVGFCVVFVFFMPVYFDFFPHYYWIFLYLSASLVFVWTGKLIKAATYSRLAFKLTGLALTLALFVFAYHWFFEGRQGHICNAAQYNYPTVLTLLLDPTDKEQVELAASCAKSGENFEILKELKALGAE